MGGVVILFAGFFRLDAWFNSSFLRSFVKTLKLTTNIRVHLGDDNNAAKFSKYFFRYSKWRYFE